MDDLWKMHLLAVVFAVASTLFILQGVEVEWRDPPSDREAAGPERE